jgi:hypothetical protein
MEPLAKDTIGGFNRFLMEQKGMGLPDDDLTLILFNHESTVVHRALLLDLVPDLTPETYQPNGFTALFDAVGDAVNSFPDVGPDERVLCLVQTDGEENSSRRITLDELKTLVSKKEQSGAWTFVFMGAGIDAFDQSARFAAATMVTNTNSYDPAQTTGAWAAMTASTTTYRGSTVRAMASGFFDMDNLTSDDANKTVTP